MAIIPWLYISLSKSILVEVILRDRKIFFDQGTFTFEICYHFKFHISFFFLYKITETDIVILKESSKFDESLAEWVHLLSPLFSRVKFIVSSNLRITLYRYPISPYICIHTTNRFHVIGINYARTLCCHAGSAALDVDRGSIRPDRAIRRRDREPR